MLYKSYPLDPSRMDVIGLFLQPSTEESVRAHNFLCMLDEVNTDAGMRRFQQLIFGQDKPILENQMLNGETIRLDGAIRMPPK